MIKLHNKYATKLIAGVLISGISFLNHASEPWPAEDRDEAIARFVSVGENSIAGEDNWSGLHWNAQSQTLWMVRNRNDNGHGEIRSYQLENNLWSLTNKVELPDDGNDHFDLEGVTQTGVDNNEILVLAEDNQQIRQYRIDSNQAELLDSWDISNIESSIDDSFEGMAYVPFASNGALVQDAENSFPGYVLVSIQEQDNSPGFANNGNIYILKLRNSTPPGDSHNSVELIDIIAIPLVDTRGLEFDQSTRILYGIDQSEMIVIKLSETFAPEVIVQYESPGPDGVEGIALTPANSASHWLMLSDDDNDDEFGAVLEYPNFRPIMYHD